MRVHIGPGYRVYFAQRGRVLLLLLCGGDKSTQARDIAKARQVLRDLGKEECDAQAEAVRHQRVPRR